MSKNNSRNKKDIKSKYYLGISNVVEGVANVHVMGSGNHYSINGEKEPPMILSKKYRDKIKPLGRILTKLGLWENGKVLQQVKKQR